jgi:hypothetical protein
MGGYLRAGEVARLAGVSVDAVRFYERRGVFPPAPRRASGYREFTAATIDRIRLARALQSFGCTVRDGRAVPGRGRALRDLRVGALPPGSSHGTPGRKDR